MGAGLRSAGATAEAAGGETAGGTTGAALRAATAGAGVAGMAVSAGRPVGCVFGLPAGFFGWRARSSPQEGQRDAPSTL